MTLTRRPKVARPRVSVALRRVARSFGETWTLSWPVACKAIAGRGEVGT